MENNRRNRGNRITRGNRGKNKTNFPSEFIVDKKIIADHKK